MSVNVSILVKGFPAMLVVAGIVCIWKGLEYDHFGVLALGVGLFIASIAAYYDYLADMKEIALEDIRYH